MAEPTDDLPEGKELVLVKSRKLISMAILDGAVVSRLTILSQALREALREVPEPDYIEITVLRYDVKDKEEGDEASHS